MKIIINISLISLFLLTNTPFTRGSESNKHWEEIHFENYLEEELLNMPPSETNEIYLDFLNSSVFEEDIARSSFDPNEDDLTVGGRVPIKDNLALILVLTLVYLIYKRERVIGFYRFR